MKNFYRIILICIGLIGNQICFAGETPQPVSQLEHKVATFTNNTVENLQYTSYKLGGRHFDLHKGIYVLDCSSYVDHILKNASPIAYHKLVNTTGSIEPTSRDYYEFFRSLPKNNPTRVWNKVENVKALHPGDILVFRFGKHHSVAQGHVMVVMNKPIPKINTQKNSTFSIRVADSASVRHSKDTRAVNDSGVGIGTMLIKANPQTGKPYAYAWQVGSHWVRNVKIAMARLLDRKAMNTAIQIQQKPIAQHKKVITKTIVHKTKRKFYANKKSKLKTNKQYNA